jgi:hypothetical protein
MALHGGVRFSAPPASTTFDDHNCISGLLIVCPSSGNTAAIRTVEQR